MTETSELEQVLNGVGEAADVFSALPAPMGTIAKIASMAFKAAAAFAKIGRDPVVEIERALKASVLALGVHGRWDSKVAAGWPDPPPIPPPSERPTRPPTGRRRRSI